MSLNILIRLNGFNLFYFFQSDIIDVNTIFKDLATMVHEQGGMVDSIEQNVESTNIRVHEGTDQLRQAEAYKVRGLMIQVLENLDVT